MIGTAWHGGANPLPASTRVEVKLRKGARQTMLAGDLNWSHYNVPEDVIEYRVAPLEHAPAFAEPGKWYLHATSCMPPALARTTIVDVKLRNGTVHRREASKVHWFYASQPHEADVIEWRVIPDDEVPPATKPGMPHPRMWQGWAGGERPVHGDAVVQVQLRDGAEGDGPARTFDWSRRGDEGAIVRYRVVPVDDGPRPDFKGLIEAIEGSALGDLCLKPKHSHYYKDVRHLDTIDVYRVIELFAVTDPCIQHALKKLLVAGGRGAGKDITKDVQEAIDSLQRRLAMWAEDAAKGGV